MCHHYAELPRHERIDQVDSKVLEVGNIACRHTCSMNDGHRSNQGVHATNRATCSLTLHDDAAISVGTFSIDREKLAGEDLPFELSDQFLDSTSASPEGQSFDPMAQFRQNGCAEIELGQRLRIVPRTSDWIGLDPKRLGDDIGIQYNHSRSGGTG